MTQKQVPKRKNKAVEYETNTFYHYANEYRKHITNEDDIEKIDFTDKFNAELDKMMILGEPMSTNINAPPGTGKSITAFALADLLTRRNFKRPFGVEDIDRDQQEFLRTMTNEKIKDTIRVVDEWNELEATGENSTVEQALYDYFSDVMGQRHVHKISCSPSECPDKNANIYLELISADRHTHINHCKLYYKIMANGIRYPQLLGFVDINVSSILEQPWYKEYRRRKFDKMNLILKEGIFRPRLMEYAKPILDVVSELKDLTILTSLINPSNVRNYVKMAFRKQKIPQSIIGEELATRESMGILQFYISYHRVNQKITHLEKQQKTGRIDPDIAEDQIRKLKEVRNKVSKGWEAQETELRHYQEIYEKYKTIIKETPQ